jgi:hypothetical protein
MQENETEGVERSHCFLTILEGDAVGIDADVEGSIESFFLPGNETHLHNHTWQQAWWQKGIAWR